MNRLNNKSVIITGAAGGMGKSEAILFAQEGARVLATDRNFELLDEWVEKARSEGLNIEAARHDVTSAADWNRIVEQCENSFLKIDVLVNNAGVYPMGKTTENTSETEWRELIDINLTGPFLGCKAVLPYLRKSGGGSIVNVSSIAGVVGGNGPAYSSSKAGLRLLTKDMAVEFAKYNIRVNALLPGGVLTPMTEGAVKMPGMDAIIKTINPQGRMADPVELAYGALFLASDESSFMTGADLVIDGGMVAK
ncbi:MAG: hypothetical protein RL021_1212 [Bacteroidota bacterium]|jgi:cyclopentanol dehydrogenase